MKRSPVRDIASMILSFHYAAYGSLLEQKNLGEGNFEMFEKWADVWYRLCSAVFLKSYSKAVEGTNILPEDSQALESLLGTLILTRALGELAYEVKNSPEQAVISARAIENILDR